MGATAVTLWPRHSLEIWSGAMGGLGVLSWLAIGAVAGWTVTRLMVTAGDEALRGTAAGLVGAVLGGLGIRLLGASSSPGANDLHALLAALAGSLWLTWITCVVSSGRERRSRPRTPAPSLARGDAAPDAETARPTLTYAAARDQLVNELLTDAMAHDAERYGEVGRRLDNIERSLPHGGAPELGRLRVALTFWDAWIGARNRGWEPISGIAKTEWPMLARIVAADLEGDRDVTDSRVVARFDVGRHPSLGNRAQALAARMRV
jgi:uncharacterized membrane protein YeaQ/YmgE (transglycosylase-associated protein family)